MHPKVLSDGGWAVLRRLGSRGWLDSWVLAGGTGLALQIGHRYSEDLDFFHPDAFEPMTLANRLAEAGNVSIQSRAPDTLHAMVEGLRLSFLRAQPPLLFGGTDYRGLVLADPRDIAVMKVIAIGGRGSRKDFVDLYFHLMGGTTLESVFALVRRRFSEVDPNEYHLLKSLVYFEDAEAEPMPRMIRDVDWEEVKERIRDEVRRFV
ncbi:MAG: nucleotidyl transferase AbiEii/AbiGii toxin family protein [Gemmatimonadota bacterium]|nr:nucleotidyl transferase AbiEii/AbiGii toxin family protein [Gemmatimonadota bacterium]